MSQDERYTKTAQATQSKTPPRSQNKRKASRKDWLVVAVVLLLGAAAGGFWFWQQNADQPFQWSAPGTGTESAMLEEGDQPAEFEPVGDSEPEPPPEEKPAPPESSTMGSLVVTANVRGANVYLNGRRVGKTPHRATPLRPGRYQLRVEMAGYQPFEQKVDVAADEGAVEATLQRMARRPVATASSSPPERREAAPELALNEAVRVKHKHRFGLRSCEGVLRASRGGIHYETDHKDAFSVPFSAMERWELDKDNLKLKIRGGKNYNFTIVDGNVDALSVFHQRVAAAMQEVNKPSQ